MKATKYISIAAAIVALAACSNEEELTSYQTDPDAVRFAVSVGEGIAISRSNPIDEDDTKRTTFNAGDVVTISAAGQQPVNYTLGSDGTSWTPEAGKYLTWDAASVTFSAYYPGNTDGVSMTGFTLPAEQETEAKIQKADYMTVTKAVARPATGRELTALALERQTARIIVEIGGFGDQFAGTTDPKVSDVKINSAKKSLAETAVTSVTPFATGEGGVNSTYTALVIPGEANAAAEFITLKVGDTGLTVTGIPAAEAGHSYTYTLIVGKDAVSIASVTVNDWATGEEISDDTEEQIQD